MSDISTRAALDLAMADAENPHCFNIRLTG